MNYHQIYFSFLCSSSIYCFWLWICKQINIIAFSFYLEKIWDMIVLWLIYHNYSFFKWVAEKMSLMAQIEVSKVATSSSTTDGAQIISNDSLLRTSAFLWFESNIKYPTTLIAWFIFPNEYVNWNKEKNFTYVGQNIIRFLFLLFVKHQLVSF